MRKLFARLFGRKPIPMPVTLSDCYLLHQMGYDIEVNDGRISKIIRRKGHGRKTACKSIRCAV